MTRALLQTTTDPQVRGVIAFTDVITPGPQGATAELKMKPVMKVSKLGLSGCRKSIAGSGSSALRMLSLDYRQSLRQRDDAIIRLHSSRGSSLWGEFSREVANEPISDPEIDNRNASGFERLLIELERLTDGWAGPGSRAPIASALRDFEAVVRSLPSEMKLPTVEVDEEAGSISVFWDGSTDSFALYLSGNGTIVGALSPFRESYRPWKITVNEAERLTRMLEDSELFGAIR